MFIYVLAHVASYSDLQYMWRYGRHVTNVGRSTISFLKPFMSPTSI